MEVNLIPVDFDPFADEQPVRISTTEPQREILTNITFGGDAANCAYNESVSLKLKGNFNFGAFESAVNALIERHASLRATFSEDGTEMIIANHDQLEVPLIDYKNIPAEDRENHLHKLISEEVSAPFDIINGPLFDVKVVELNDDVHTVIITGHHLILDGWSIGMVMQDLGKFYNAFCKNQKPELDHAIEFNEYVDDELAYKQSDEYHETEEFWLNMFKDSVPAMDLFIDKPRPVIRTYDAKRYDLEIDSALVNRLKKTAQKQGISFVNMLLASFEVYLWRLTGSSDMVIGLPASGQVVTGKHSLVGHSVNLLPVRSFVDGSLPFTEYLKQRKKSMMDVYDHQRYTVGTLIQKINLPRDPSRIPITPFCLNLDMGITDGVSFDNLQMEFSSNPRSFENFEIFLNISGQQNKLIIECTYNTNLFDDEMMHLRMNEAVELLSSIAENPNSILSELNLIPANENELLESFNQNYLKYPEDKCIHQLFEEIAERLPDATAIYFGEEEISYQELNERANIIANYLIERGLQPMQLVAVCLERSPDLIAALLAVSKAGCTYLPVDPEYPAERIAYMLESSETKFLISQSPLLEVLNLKIENSILLVEDWQKNIKHNIQTPSVSLNSNVLAYILYTSGSTGKPKGVMIKHTSLVNQMKAFEKIFSVTPADKILAVTTISFDISELEIHLPLISGAAIVLATREDAMNANALMQLITKNNITMMQATPVTWRMLMEAGWDGNKQLKVLCGGEAMPVDLANYLSNKCKKVWNVYGPTETTVWSSVYEVDDAEFNETNESNRPVKIGKPVYNNFIYVLDERLKQCPVGIEGEIFIGGVSVAEGYYKRNDLTEERFINDPFDFSGLSKIYRTGDKGKFDLAGNLEYTGRADFQVKIRGYRIELGEIENVLSQHPSVKQNAVVVQEENNDKKLVAFIVSNNELISSENKIDETSNRNELQTEEQLFDELKSFLQSRLPKYMVPVAFKVVDEMPVTPAGKLNRKLLQEMSVSTYQSSQPFVTPRNETENLLALMWESLLNLQKVSVHDNFFEAGGHSLIAVRLMMEIERVKNIKLPLAILFTNPTIEQLAKVIDSKSSGDLWKPITVIRATGNKKPLFFAHGVSGNVFKYYLLGKMLSEDIPVYGLQAKGLNGKDIPFNNMEEMAAWHIEEILKLQPEGPFRIGGGSFGGYLAYEIARQLIAMNHQVDFVGLFDLEATTRTAFMNPVKKSIVDIGLKSQRFVSRVKTFATSGHAERLKYIRDKIANPAVDLQRQKMDEFLNKKVLEENYGTASAEYFNAVEDACYLAMNNYKLQPANCKVILFRALEGFYSIEYDRDLGWGFFAKQGCDVIEVPGNHNSIFEQPHVTALAEVLQKTLDQLHSG